MRISTLHPRIARRARRIRTPRAERPAPTKQAERREPPIWSLLLPNGYSPRR